MLKNLQQLAIDHDAIVSGLNVVRQNTQDRVVLEQVSHRLERTEIIHCHNLDWRL